MGTHEMGFCGLYNEETDYNETSDCGAKLFNMVRVDYCGECNHYNKDQVNK